MSKYYDGSEKTNEQVKGTKKSTAKKILKGVGSVLGLVVAVVGGVNAVNKNNNKG